MADHTGPAASATAGRRAQAAAFATAVPSSATPTAPSRAAAKTSSTPGTGPAQASAGVADAACQTESTSAERFGNSPAASWVACLASSEPS